jgi:hypothetical protein
MAYGARAQTDYYFESMGMVIFLTIITCGIFGFYVFYQLMKRMRDHNRRRLDLLESATELAWQRASQQGVAEELRPNFERIAANVAVMRGLTTEFRDPGIWVIIAILTSIAYFVGFVFLDGDLIKHDQAEGAVEAELSAIFARLGQNVPVPDPSRQKEAELRRPHRGQHLLLRRLLLLVDVQPDGRRQQALPLELAVGGRASPAPSTR